MPAPSDEKLEEVGRMVMDQIKGTSFVLVVFHHHHPTASKTVVNVNNKTTIAALESALKKIKEIEQ